MKQASGQNCHFVLRKIHSLLGVVPVGLFLCFHLFMNSKAISESKETPFAEVVESIESFHPERIFLLIVEAMFIFLPLLLHAIYGFVIWWQGKSNVAKYRHGRNWMYLLQRFSGLIIFLFLILHVWKTRFAGSHTWDGSYAPGEIFPVMHELLNQTGTLLLYIVGLVASCFHFANGLWLVGITWGLTIGPRSQRNSSVVAAAIGLILLVLGGVALYGFAVNTPVVAHG